MASNLNGLKMHQLSTASESTSWNFVVPNFALKKMKEKMYKKDWCNRTRKPGKKMSSSDKMDLRQRN